MIPNLMNSRISFQAKELKSAREAYSNVLKENQKTAQEQLLNNPINNNQLNKPILMQGQGEKLDVTA